MTSRTTHFCVDFFGSSCKNKNSKWTMTMIGVTWTKRDKSRIARLKYKSENLSTLMRWNKRKSSWSISSKYKKLISDKWI
jgi:hypothetical protein